MTGTQPNISHFLKGNCMHDSLTGNTRIATPVARVAPARERIETALGRKRGGKFHCPAHPDTHPSLAVYDATGYQGVYLKCFTGCQQDDILSALGLTTSDKFDQIWEQSSPAKDAIRQLRAIPREWAGRAGRNQEILYNSCLTRAWDANSLTIEYSGYQAALRTPLSRDVAARTFRQLSARELIASHGIRERGHGNSYELITRVGNTKAITKYKPSIPLTGSFPNCLTFPHLASLGIETKTWLRPSGLAVVKVMSYDEAKPISAVAREAEVDRKTARNVLTTMLRSNGLAEETPEGWRLTGDLAGFHPGTDIMGRRAEDIKRRRADYARKLAGYPAILDK